MLFDIFCCVFRKSLSLLIARFVIEFSLNADIAEVNNYDTQILQLKPECVIIKGKNQI